LAISRRKQLAALIRLLWLNRKAEIAIVTAIVALVRPYVH
jgi:hypothetical protein